MLRGLIMLKISKDLLVDPNVTILVFSEKNKVFTVCIVKTTLNPDFYNGFRVKITDGEYAYWPVKYSDSISYDGLKPPKYVQKLTKRAFNLLERSFN